MTQQVSFSNHADSPFMRSHSETVPSPTIETNNNSVKRANTLRDSSSGFKDNNNNNNNNNQGATLTNRRSLMRLHVGKIGSNINKELLTFPYGLAFTIT